MKRRHVLFLMTLVPLVLFACGGTQEQSGQEDGGAASSGDGGTSSSGDGGGAPSDGGPSCKVTLPQTFGACGRPEDCTTSQVCIAVFMIDPSIKGGLCVEGPIDKSKDWFQCPPGISCGSTASPPYIFSCGK